MNSSGDLEIIGYADDFTFVIAHKRQEELKNMLDQILTIAKEEAKVFGLDIAEEKTQILPISKLHLEYFDNYSFSTNFKILGIHINRSLTWALHIKETVKKLHKEAKYLKAIYQRRQDADGGS